MLELWFFDSCKNSKIFVCTFLKFLEPHSACAWQTFYKCKQNISLHFFIIFVKEGERQAKLLQDQFGSTKVNFKRVDVSSNSNFESAFEKCLELYGGIDVVVNNAGVEGEINWETQLQINFLVRIINLFYNRYNFCNLWTKTWIAM